MKAKMKRDALLVQFKNFEIDKSFLFGGFAQDNSGIIVGSYQLGSNSYLDVYIPSQRETVCNWPFSYHDSSNWNKSAYVMMGRKIFID